MAAAILAHLAQGKSLRFQIKSAGTCVTEGEPTSSLARATLDHRRIDPGPHVATPLTAELIGWADLVLTMTSGHKRDAAAMSPENAARVFTITEYVDVEGEVTDPLPKGTAQAYEQCADQLESLISQAIRRVKRS